MHIIAQKADGALRDALSIFDRIVSASIDKTVKYVDVLENLNVLDYDYYFRITDALLAEDVSKTLLIYDDVMRKGFEGETLLTGLAEHFRNILVSKDNQTLQLLEVGDKLKARYQQQATIASTTFLLTALNLMNDCDVNFKQARNKRLHVEMALIKTAFISRAVDLATTSVEKKTPDIKAATKRIEKSENGTPKIENQNSAAGVPSEKFDTQNAKRETFTPPQYIAEKLTISTVQEPVATYEGDTPPGPAVSTAKSMPAGMMAMPKIGSIDSIAKLIEEEEALLALAVSKLNYENLVESWKKYAEAHESPSTKTAILSAQLDLDITAAKVVARVGTTLAVGFIQSEMRLSDFLRFDLNEQNLTLEVKLDDALTPDEAKTSVAPKKYLSPREKLKLMMEVNPLVKDFAVKLGLKPDE